MAGLRLGNAIPNLTRWGLSSDADLVFRALTLEPHQSAAELGRALGVARRRVDEALEELLAAGLGRRGGEPARPGWSVRPPDAAVLALQQRRQLAENPAERTRRLLTVVAKLSIPPHVTAHRQGVRHLPFDRVGERIAELVAAERHEHLAIQPDMVFSREVLEEGLGHDRELARRGVRLRVVTRTPPDGDAGRAPLPQDAGTALDVRESEDVPLRLMAFDRRVVLLPAGPDFHDGAIEVTHPDLVSAAVALFTARWDRGRDPRTSGVPRIVLSARERAVVDALAGGLTDTGVAVALRLSVRTIGYTLRALMDRTGVENRFQLGLVLGAAGVTAPPGAAEASAHRSA